MTIINRERAQAYSDFRYGCESAPEATFTFSMNVYMTIKRAADKLESEAHICGILTDKCDAFYEVEAHMFEMIRNANPDRDIEAVIGLGRALSEADSDGQKRIIDGLVRDREAFKELTGA